MIIAIDGYEANQFNRVGIGEYAYQLLQNIYQLSVNDPNSTLQFRIYLPTQPLTDMPAPSKNWKYIVRKPNKLWTFLALPISLYLDKPRANIVFSPTHYVPRFTSISKVMSIMDLSFLYFPELFKPKDLYQLKHWTRYSISKAKYIFTISEYSKNAIIKEYKFSKDRIIVTYPGIPIRKTVTMISNKQVKEKYSLSNPYILSVGTIQPRKNYVRLIEAFSILVKQNNYKDHELVIVGKKGWLFEDILNAPKKYGVDTKVKFLDFVSDEELPHLYSEAECFALPSLYEGFGLPALEAMANNCIVVVSSVSSLPEIVGDAGILVDPGDVSDIVRGISKALKEKNSPEGKIRVKNGQNRVKLFSWENSAKKTLEILEKAGTVVL